MEYEETQTYLKEILESQKISYDNKKLEEIVEYSIKIYKDKFRYSGKTVLEHAIGVAIDVAKLNMDITSIYAAILHEVPKYNNNDYAYILEKFGEEIVEIIKGIDKLGYLSYDNKIVDAEKLRNMFMGVAKDARVVIIKLVDRLYDMNRIYELNEAVQIKLAKETLEIYAPIAHRFGISQVKSELEDISFRILYSKEYNLIKVKIDEKKKEREHYIETRILELEEHLKLNNVSATIYGRPKHFYSIYKKIKMKNCEIDDLYDLLAIRIIVDSVKDCYNALGIVHELYRPMPGRFKDYIAVPKTNMYQSLHTTVFGDGGKPFEIQIRTWDMHKVADYGVAAHFLYKEKASFKLSDTDKKIVWLRQMLETQQELASTNDITSDMKLELFGEEVFVFTPKGDIKALPKDSTTIDYAYLIHQHIAEKMIGAKINSKMVPINTKLNNTDVVEIVTSSNSTGPNRDWLKYVKTSGAKSKIVSYLKKQGREVNTQKGKDIFEKELRKRKLLKEDILKDEYVSNMLKRANFNSLDECYENIGFGSVSQVKILNKLLEEKAKLEARESNKLVEHNFNSKKITQVSKKDISSSVSVDGIKNCLVKFSKCCNPIPGDDIVGYITQGHGVSIHRTDCVNLNTLDITNRKIGVKWQSKQQNLEFVANINIKANNRTNIVTEILKNLEELKISVESVNAKVNLDREVIISITINIDSSEKLQKVIRNLKKVDSVYEVKRTK